MQQRLASAALDRLTAQPDVQPTSKVAACLEVRWRTSQSAPTATIGWGPDDVGLRIRWQGIARCRSGRPPDTHRPAPLCP